MNAILQKRIEEAADEYQNLVIEETKCHHNHTMTYAQGYEDARLLVKPTFIDAADWALQNQWISVEEALPPIREKDIGNRSWSDWVLIMTHGGGAFMDCYAFHRKEWLNNGNDVTYWTPIPELPKGDDE